jgi:hypothetical protein
MRALLKMCISCRKGHRTLRKRTKEQSSFGTEEQEEAIKFE